MCHCGGFCVVVQVFSEFVEVLCVIVEVLCITVEVFVYLWKFL